jgi:hypothetical protein
MSDWTVMDEGGYGGCGTMRDGYYSFLIERLYHLRRIRWIGDVCRAKLGLDFLA